MIKRLLASGILTLGWNFPAYAAAVQPATLSCAVAEDPGYCASQRQDFLKAWPKANSGDYLAQRQIAFCYSSGCSGLVQINLVKACTWETVIVSTEKSDVTDAFNFRQVCEQLTPVDRNIANNAALSLYGKIYKNLMTKPLPYEAPK